MVYFDKCFLDTGKIYADVIKLWMELFKSTSLWIFFFLVYLVDNLSEEVLKSPAVIVNFSFSLRLCQVLLYIFWS